jgi:nucleotide-binding universal stress UspA family protein
MSLAKRDGAALELVMVWQPVTSLVETGAWSQQLDEWQEQKMAEERIYLSEMARRVGKAMSRTASVKYLQGRPEEELARWAHDSGADLVVMATHGHGPFSRVWLGSVADRLIRKGVTPVLLVRCEDDCPEVEIAPAHSFDRILIPLDGSDFAQLALDNSLLLGSRTGATVTLLTSVSFPVALAAPEGAVVLDYEAFLAAQKDYAQKYLAGIAATLASWPCKVETRVIESTLTWKAIVDFATAGGYDLIAMATHGRGGAARALLGSVADKVVRSSPVPTLLFHPDLSRQKKGGIQQRLAAEVLVDWP